MLTIRFSKIGKKKKPTFRLIVLDKKKDPWGDYLEQVGTYNPHTKETHLTTERIKYWISVGAQPSASVNNLLIKEGVIDGAKQKSVRISKKRAAKKAASRLAEEKEKAERPEAKAEPKEKKPVAETPKEEIKEEVKADKKAE